jgi:hypothetical protein
MAAVALVLREIEGPILIDKLVAKVEIEPDQGTEHVVIVRNA